MPGESKKISELESASSLNNGDLLELASVNALSETGYSSKKTTIEDVADKIATLNPQAQADWTEADNTEPSYIQNKPTLAAVATSGSYNDLQDQPQIPAAQVNSDWNSVSGVSEILNKPTLGTAASKNTGVANGVAELDANGLVPTSQLPAYVDDVLEYASQSAFPATGETGKIYVALDTNLTYRWSGSAYVEISPSLALGETSSTAYAGNKGKANADAISAIQSTLSGLATVATTGDYDDLIDKPAINDATITFTQGGTTKGSITLNQAADATIALDAGGGGGSNSVELTYEEYQALTPEQQLDGTEYFITDINGDGQQFQPICYSEEEREIGVWTDGKPLYQKTLVVNPFAIAPSGTLAHNISDIDVVVDYDIFITRTGGVSIKFTWATINNASTTVSVDTANIVFAGTDNWPTNTYTKLYATIRYTKSTDTAGSGTWTPQGVPAVHYSTTEQVVGTWIDGSTIYEKTFTNISLTHNTWNNDILGTSGSGITILEFDGKLSIDNATPYCNLDYYRNASEFTCVGLTSNGGVNIYPNVSNPEKILFVTIRYTKASA